MWLRQSTASQEIKLGPFLDSLDFNSQETGLTIANTDIKLTKGGATTEVDKNSGGATHVAGGRYSAVLDATDTDTLGIIEVDVHVAGALAVHRRYMILPAVIYDSLVLGTDNLPANILEISDDSTAADNLELQYDTTGVTGDTFPATQAQIGQLSTGSSSISIQSESYVLTTGTQSSGTFANTATVDNIYHEHTDTAGVIDLYYQFDVSGNGTASNAQIDLRINGANDSITVYAWDWGGAAWDQIDFLAGTNGSIDSSLTPALLIRHTGTGADLGKVRIRFEETGLTTATLRIDRIITSYAVVSQSVGYANGLIWVDTNASNTNTEIFVDGVADNPVSTWAAALTLSTALGIKGFNLASGSSIALSANSDAYTILAVGASIDQGSQSIEGATFIGGTITGTGTATVTPPSYRACKIGVATIPPSNQADCQYLSTMTLGSNGDYFINDGKSGVAGSSSPVIDYNSIASSSTVNIRSFSGGLNGINIVATTVSSWEFRNGGTAQVTGTGGSVFIRGQVSNTVNNSLGLVIMDITGVMNQTTNGVVRTGLAQGPGTGNNQIQLDASASAVDGAYDPGQIAIISGVGAGQSRLIIQYAGASKTATVDRNWKVNPDTTSTFLITTNPGREHVNEGLAQAATSNTITLNALASASSDTYRGQICFVRSGTGEDQSGTVIDYNGTTKVATIDKNWDVTPDATSGYVMLPASPVILANTTHTGAVIPTVTTCTTVNTCTTNTDMLTTAAILASGDADGFTIEEALKLLLSASTGVLSGAETNTVVIKAADGSKTRLTATVDANGNRSVVVRDAAG